MRNNTRLTSQLRSFGLLAIVVAVAGCGNVFDHLSMGEWREVGLPEARIICS